MAFPSQLEHGHDRARSREPCQQRYRRFQIEALACACADGDPEALRYFESEFLSQVDLYVARFSFGSHTLDEVRQRIRVKLLVGDSPGITGYRGRGPLAAWIRITAVRIAIDVARRAGVIQPSPNIDLLEFGFSVEDNPELAAVRNLYRERLRAALEQALSALETRDKTLLRLSVVDGLNIDQIGAVYRVHRATVARWLVAIRSRVLGAVRKRLGLRIPPSSSELRSLIGMFEDDIHISAKRVLAAEA